MKTLLLILSMACVNVFADITPEQVKAKKDLEAKAVAGDANAQYALGVSYLRGNRDTNFVTNYTEAHKWLRKAADQGNSKAQFALGQAYYSGEGVAVNFVEAVKWYRKAAEQGNTDAMQELGDCYRKGEGVKMNLVEAYALLSITNRARGYDWGSPAIRAAGEKRLQELQKQIEAKIANSAGK